MQNHNATLHLEKSIRWKKLIPASSLFSLTKRLTRMIRKRIFLQQRRMLQDVHQMKNSYQKSIEEPSLPFFECKELKKDDRLNIKFLNNEKKTFINIYWYQRLRTNIVSVMVL